MGYTSVGVSQGVLTLRFTSQGVLTLRFTSQVGLYPGLPLRWVYIPGYLSGVLYPGLPPRCVIPWFTSQVGILVGLSLPGGYPGGFISPRVIPGCVTVVNSLSLGYSRVCDSC